MKHARSGIASERCICTPHQQRGGHLPGCIERDEEWKSIPTLCDYQASNKGRIRASIGGQVRHQWPLSSHTPYPVIKVGRQKYLVHRLVAEAFHGPCPVGAEVNHKDGDKTNPHKDNLEYITHAQNVKHAYDTGLSDTVRVASSEAMRKAHAEGRVNYCRGERKHNSKLTDQTARLAKDAIATGESDPSIARRFGVARETIRQIRQGRTWKHV